MLTPEYDTFADPEDQPQNGSAGRSGTAQSDGRGVGPVASLEGSPGHSDGTLTVSGRDPGGRFLTGNRAAVPGSRRGRRNRRTLSGLELLEQLERGGDGLPSAEDRLRLLLTDPDPHVRLRIEVWLFTMLHGLPARRATEADLLASPEWRSLRTTILDALDGYPEASKAVSDAIKGVDPARLGDPQPVKVTLRWLDQPDP